MGLNMQEIWSGNVCEGKWKAGGVRSRLKPHEREGEGRSSTPSFKVVKSQSFPLEQTSLIYPCCPRASAGCRSWEIRPSALSWSGFQSIAAGATGQLNSLPKEIWETQCPD